MQRRAAQLDHRENALQGRKCGHYLSHRTQLGWEVGESKSLNQATCISEKVMGVEGLPEASSPTRNCQQAQLPSSVISSPRGNANVGRLQGRKADAAWGKDAEEMWRKSIQCGENNYPPIKNKCMFSKRC